MERVEQDTERDFFMTPDQAKEYGLIDDIITATSPAAQEVVGAGSAVR
jgi:ATP-dependent Clp protease protease subunit